MREVKITIVLPDPRPYRWPIRVRFMTWILSKVLGIEASWRIRRGEPSERVEAWVTGEVRRIMPDPTTLVPKE